MLSAKQNFIPVLTSEAGLCLTSENWFEVNVSIASYSLEHLLYKPGQESLNKNADLADYLVCPGKLVINASSLICNKEGMYVLKSPYDGSKIRLSCFDFSELIHHLKPYAVILPKKITRDFPQIWDNWNDAVVPFIGVDDLESQSVETPRGIYFKINNADDLNYNKLNRWSHIPRYVTGDFDLEFIQKLHRQGIDFIETDEPARAAMQGRVYSHSGEVDLTNAKTRMQFELIDKQCACPTCKQQFTRAYLHHLLQHTPLLCHRFLIQHNVFYINFTLIHLPSNQITI